MHLTYVHLWSTAPQQVNEGRVEGHDGVPQVDLVLLVLLLSSEPGQQIPQSDSTRHMAPIRLTFVPFCIVRNISHFFVIDLIQLNVNANWMRLHYRFKGAVGKLQVLHGEASVLLDGRSISGRVFRYLDGLLYRGQQAVAALPSQGRSKALRTTDEQPYYHVGILLHALPYEPQTRKPEVSILLHIAKDNRPTRQHTIRIENSGNGIL